MYDERWAREIQLKYRKLCTRAQQMDRVIEQTLWESYSCKCPPEIISAILTDSIRRKGLLTLWPAYKRLNKKSPLDKELLDKVCKLLIKSKVSDHIDDSHQYKLAL